VLDTSVMNVSISQLVEDFHTDVTAIQAVITIYTLVMAAFMITGGKVGDRLGRRRAFGLGLVIYAVRSLLTAVAPTLLVLTLGWPIIEGLGAALAFQTGLRLLPVSVTMLVTAAAAPLLNRVATPRTVVRCGFALLVIAGLWLVGSIDPELDEVSFGTAMALLGIGMGLLAAQLGNVAQSSVGEADRGEVGGLQYTAQNLGSSLGTAFIGSILIGALGFAALRGLSADPRISYAVQQQAGVAISGGVNFVPLDQAQAALENAGIPTNQIDALLSTYADAQLLALKVAILAAAAIALASLFLTRHLPTVRLAARPGQAPAPAAPADPEPEPLAPGR
jgi:MFS family permease